MPRTRTKTTKTPKTKTTKTTKTTTIDESPDVEALETLKAEGTAPVESPSGAGANVEAPGSSETPTPGDTVPRKKRGRPRKAEPPPDVIPRALMKAFIKTPYMFAARRFGGHWELSDAEAEQMVETHMELAREYAPAWLQDRPALYVCLFQHAMLIIGRVDIQRRLEALEAKPVEDDEDEDEASINAGLPQRGHESGSDLPREARHGKVFPDAPPPAGS